MIMYKSVSRRIFELFLYLGFLLFLLAIVIPFLNVIAISFSSKRAVQQYRVVIVPVEFQTKAYEAILSSRVFGTSLANSALLAVVNTTLSIAIALLAGYALANKDFIGRRVVFIYFLIPLYFSGGLVPFYLAVNSYGLNNTRLALILPYLVSVFYIIVFRNVIARLPKEIMESAEVDGANDEAVLFRIVFHLILPTIAAFAIFSGVGYWNEWFAVLIFVRDQSKWTLQYLLRSIYSNPSLGGGVLDVAIDDPENTLLPQNLINAAIICTVAPIMVIYPFLQRYFIHGVLVGAVKE
jgi:putative aldouronate transport system permease protein